MLWHGSPDDPKSCDQTFPLPQRGDVQVDHADQRLKAIFNDPGNQLIEVTQNRLDYGLYRIADLGCGI